MMAGSCEAHLRTSELETRCHALLAGGGRMQMAYAWFPEATAEAELCYLSTQGAGRPFDLWRCPAKGGRVPSLAPVSPLLGWYEREISDLTGVCFEGHPEAYALVLPAGTEVVAPPLSPDYPAGTPVVYHHQPGRLPDVLGPEVQELPFGPVRAGVLESAQFLFFYLGEHILRYQPRLFFKHRGMEQRFQGCDAGIGTVLAERVSGVGSVCHALAYCQAVEAAAGGEVPRRARHLRVLLAELERLYNHLHYFSHLAATTTLKLGEAEGLLLEERVKQINARLSGSRLLRNLLSPGGLRHDLDPGPDFRHALTALRPRVMAYLMRLQETGSYIDRLIDTGVLSRRVAFDQGATGPVERASGLDRDLRRDHPYAAYDTLPPRVPVRTAGDAAARAEVRAGEIEASFDLIVQLLDQLSPGAVHQTCPLPPGAEGLGWAEGPRGSLLYAVHVAADGLLARVKIKSPSFSNWRVFPYTVHDSNMMDYAINEASFGLTVAGCAR